MLDMNEEKREKAREATRKWRRENPDKVREGQRKSYYKNREKKIARVLQWAKDNPDKYNARMKRWRAENREKINAQQRNNRAKRLYGLSLVEIAAEVKKNNGCACCGATEPGNKFGWVVDHCHTTGDVRGVLCHHCNLALGNVKDSVDHLRKLISYLER